MTDPAFPKDLLGLIATLTRQRSPVIVTFGECGEVVDTFGELNYYADTKETLVELLGDLLVGWHERVDALAEVQMPSGRYADVRIVPEGAMRHVILFDAACGTVELREVLQASHEMALMEQRRRAGLERRFCLSTERHQGADELRDAGRNRMDVVEMLSWDIRARLDEIRGHAQILDEGVAKPSAEAHSVSSIKRASMHLHGLALACIAALQGGSTCDAIEHDAIDIKRLVEELQSQFGEGPQLQRVCFEADYPLGSSHLVAIEYARVYQIIVCLVTCLLDATGETLTVRMFVDRAHFGVEILPDPDAREAGTGLHGLLGDLRYAATHQLVGALGGRLSCPAGLGVAVRLELPLSSIPPAVPGHGHHSSPPSTTTVLVAIDDSGLRERVLAQLLDLGLCAHTCDELAAVEYGAVDSDVAMIILGGAFAGAAGIGLSYRLHAAGVRRRMLLLRSVAGLGPSAWVFDGRRTIISSTAADEVLRTAIEGALRI